MANDNAIELVNFTLSREELLFTLNLLEAPFIPGLDPDPLGEFTPEQRALALTVAGRALRARELVQIHNGGEWVLHNALLAAVGSCAYAQSVVSLVHWPPQSDAPARFFGHLRDNVAVVHTRPADVLHRFALLPSKEQLITQTLAFCGYEDGGSAPAFELSVPGAVFVQARELAAAGETAQAVDTLAGSTTAPEAAQALAETLGSSPTASVLQTLKGQADGTVQKQDLTLLQNGQRAWLIMAAPDEAAPLRVKTTSKDEMQALLAAGL